ncbi:MAG: hypothetical protein DWQ08_04370, partial [Proteobacteria bacterium]
MSNSVATWLERIGLGEYRGQFLAHHIDWELLRDLDQATLKDIGVSSAGHRLQILKAIRELDAAPGGKHSRVATDEAERRQLTVMFCDLAGSTEMSQRLDPEDLRDINRAYQDACKRAIERFDGFVARYMGDGVLAYFGFPRAHEDDAERAILAGLSVAEAVDELDRGIGAERNLELLVRVGIATGAVVVGDLIGEGASQESAVVGETPNLAARLQSMAAPGAVVVSAATHELCAERFDFIDLGLHMVKGIAEPVRAWRPLAPVAAPSR